MEQSLAVKLSMAQLKTAIEFGHDLINEQQPEDVLDVVLPFGEGVRYGRPVPAIIQAAGIQALHSVFEDRLSEAMCGMSPEEMTAFEGAIARAAWLFWSMQ